MRALRVVMSAPLFNDDLRFLEAAEQFAVEQLIAQLAVEGLAVAVLPRAAGCDEQRLRAQTSQPVTHDVRCHLRTVVPLLQRAADVCGLATTRLSGKEAGFSILRGQRLCPICSD